MNTEVLELLEFLRVRELLVELATSHLGKERLRALVPYSNCEKAQSVLVKVDALRRLQDAGKGMPPVGLPDLSDILRKLDREGLRLEPEEFREMGKLLERVRGARIHGDSLSEEGATIGELIACLEPHTDLEDALRKTFEPTGAIRDSASSTLRRIRRERERLRSSLRTQMEKRAGEISEGSLVTLREGRFVLSLPKAKERSVKGIQVDRSGTGATVYLEPLDAVEDNNRLRSKDAEEFEEVRRILLGLTRQFATHGPSLSLGYEALGKLDDLSARAKLAVRWRAQPPVFTPDSRLELFQARHPLLLESRDVASSPDAAFASVIPLTLDLGPGKHMLLISGPNMGGKTVALKCVGLLTLMAQSGLCIPVTGSAKLGWFDRLVVDVGDEQSLEGDVSTFAGHLHHWREALQAAGVTSLVLLDELGSGTDPTEGAALAQSVLEVLVAEDTVGIITTHSRALKRYAAEAEGIENAGMVFDGASGSPTFTLAVGVPGDSHALEMAAHLGFPKERVQRAEALLSQEERDLKKLIRDVEHERESLRAERDQAAEEIKQAGIERGKAKETLDRVLESRRELRDRAARQARSILRKAQAQARELERAHQLEKTKASKMHRAVAERQVKLSRLERSPTVEKALGPPPQKVEAGQHYLAVSLGGPVTVLRLFEGESRVLVDRRGMRVELPLSDLREGTDPGPPGGTRILPSPGDVPREIYLIGKRTEDALEILDQALDRALLAGFPELRVVHGFGTGALMNAVRKFCDSHPAVQSYRAGEKGEGGGGATILMLDDA